MIYRSLTVKILHTVLQEEVKKFWESTNSLTSVELDFLFMNRPCGIYGIIVKSFYYRSTRYYVVQVDQEYYIYHQNELKFYSRTLPTRTGRIINMDYGKEVSDFIHTIYHGNYYPYRDWGRKTFTKAWGRYFMDETGTIYHRQEIDFSYLPHRLTEWFNAD